MKNVLRSSEFWITLVTALLQVFQQFGILPKETAEATTAATGGGVIYVAGRVISKIVKAAF